MKLHANAALSLKGRRQLCQRVLEDEGWTVTEAAAAAEVSVRCARKWIGRYQAEGEVGLRDRLRGARARSRTAPRSGGCRRSRRSGGCGSPALRSPRCSGWPRRRCRRP